MAFLNQRSLSRAAHPDYECMTLRWSIGTMLLRGGRRWPVPLIVLAYKLVLFSLWSELDRSCKLHWCEPSEARVWSSQIAVSAPRVDRLAGVAVAGEYVLDAEPADEALGESESRMGLPGAMKCHSTPRFWLRPSIGVQVNSVPLREIAKWEWRRRLAMRHG